MTDYNKYLDGLMADCRRSVQYPTYHPQHHYLTYPQYLPPPPPLHFQTYKEPRAFAWPQYFARPTPPPPPLHFQTYKEPRALVYPQYIPRPPPPPPPLHSQTYKEPRAIAPRPCISRDLTATAPTPAAYTSRNVFATANAPRANVPIVHPLPAAGPRPDVPKNPPPTETAPRPRVTKKLPPPAATSHPNVNNDVQPAANAPRPAIPKILSPATTASSPFVPLFQLPIANSISECAPQNITEPTTPICDVEPRKDTRKGCVKERPNKESHIRYKNMAQSAMREELKARGLVCHGPNADLVKRLEQDDAFQAKPRTAENYDTLDPEKVRGLCVRRFIPSHGTVSSIKDRLKAHDKRESREEAAGRRLRPVRVSNEALSILKIKASREMLKERPLVSTVNDELASTTETAEIEEKMTEIVAPSKHKTCVEFKPMKPMLSTKPRHKACIYCRKSKVCSIPTI